MKFPQWLVAEKADAMTATLGDQGVTKSQENSYNRVFLGNIKLQVGEECPEALARQFFQKRAHEVLQQFGEVKEVFVPDRTSKRYAFVTMESPEQAQCAIDNASSWMNEICDVVRPALSMLPRNQVSPKKVEHHQVDFQKKRNLAEKSNCIVQLHKSHSERLVELLGSKVVGMTTEKTVAFVFCMVEDPSEFSTWLSGVWYVRPVLQRIFMLKGKGTNHQLVQCSSLDDLATIAVEFLDSALSKKQCKLRLATFPNPLQESLLSRFEAMWDTCPLKSRVQFSPSMATSTMEVLEYTAPNSKLNQDGLYSLVLKSDDGPHFGPKESSDEICRAFGKLQEATERYSFGDLPPNGGIALDVGASPGGWTQFLLEKFKCDEIFSVDPGQLHPRILEQHQVHHLPMTFACALPEIAQRLHEGHHARWYVSDMCVKDVGAQVDSLLLAVSLGIVQAGTFVVLTLKCTRGHSKETFDHLVSEEVSRLPQQLHIIHLFRNRSSERTVIGYWPETPDVGSSDDNNKTTVSGGKRKWA